MKRTQFWQFILLFIFLSYSCSSDYPVSDIVENVNVEKGISAIEVNLSQSDAQFVAKSFMNRFYDKKALPATRSSAEAESINDSNGNPMVYVVNFNEGGFCIVSATKDYYPILAYSDEGRFSVSDIDNTGVSIWIEETEDAISQEIIGREEQTAINLAWLPYEEQSSTSATTRFTYDPDIMKAMDKRTHEIMLSGNRGIPLSHAQNALEGDLYSRLQQIASLYSCPEEYMIVLILNKDVVHEVGPLMNTNWNQYSPFGDKTPNGVAGCTAIAAGQIMNFHQHPARYNWAHMTNENLNRYDDIKDLMVDIGRAFEMNYDDPKASGANIGNVKKGLENTFGYNVTKKENDNDEVMNYILRQKSPVYMKGHSSKSGHAWVCDGANYTHYQNDYQVEVPIRRNGEYVYFNNGTTYFSTSSLYQAVHLNWGWDRNNGWYYSGVTQATPSDNDYKNNRENLFITPK